MEYEEEHFEQHNEEEPQPAAEDQVSNNRRSQSPSRLQNIKNSVMSYLPSIKMPSFLGGKKGLDVCRDAFLNEKHYSEQDRQIAQELKDKFQCDC